MDGKRAISFQKASRIIVWDLPKSKILKEIEDQNATCIDANGRANLIVVGLRNGLIVVFTLNFEDDLISNVSEVELGVIYI